MISVDCCIRSASHSAKRAQADDLGAPRRPYQLVFCGVCHETTLPEFVNRIDDMIVFEPLNQSEIAEIAQLQLRALNVRLAEQGLALELDHDTMLHVSEQGYDPVYGARPLKRAFQRLIENPLANAMLETGFSSGSVVLGNWFDEQLVLTEKVV